MWSNIKKTNFDLIIDDGLHTFNAAITLFENSIEYLKDVGIYIVEDPQDKDLIKFKNYFDDNLSIYNYSIINLKKQQIVNRITIY